MNCLSILKFVITLDSIDTLKLNLGNVYVIGGILLPDASGISDPCEKEPHDVFSNLNSQQREDITAAAQHTLRLIAFRQVITSFPISVY